MLKASKSLRPEELYVGRRFISAPNQPDANGVKRYAFEFDRQPHSEPARDIIPMGFETRDRVGEVVPVLGPRLIVTRRS